jgi:MFS family permease
MSDVSRPPSDSIEDMGQSWYRLVSPDQWRVLFGSTLGWLFDGYEGFAIVLVLIPALTTLMPGADMGTIATHGGYIISAMLFGWATGGVLGGIAADYLGRKRTMIISILTYAIFTGLSGFVTTWEILLVFRFLTGLGIGAEWANGTSLIAETWPQRARPVGLGLMQSGYGWGQLVAAGLWFWLSTLSPEAWRYLFFFGALPALVTLYIRRRMKESERWEGAAAERAALQAEREAGAELDPEQERRTRFTLSYIFSIPRLRKNLLFATALSLATVVGFWAISTWIPAQAQTLAQAEGSASPARAAANVGLWYTIGAIVGYILIGFIADRIKRKPIIAIWFLSSVILTPVTFFVPDSLLTLYWLALINGFFTLGQFAWMPIYLPELFPTLARGTASSFVFSTTRYLAAFGPLISGILVATFGGYGIASTIFAAVYLLALPALLFLPDTTRQPLPE